jgi:hypothetical protein
MTTNITAKKWQERLNLELSFQERFEQLSVEELLCLVKKRKLTSSNYDTVLSIDWPHFCSGATKGCGGENGWCYTFQGRHSDPQHHEKVALVDLIARRFPEQFASKIVEEVLEAVQGGLLTYANLRFSGSGETALEHVPALKLVKNNGVTLWGFSRSLPVAKALRSIGASVLFSCDITSRRDTIRRAIDAGFKLSYTSIGVDDRPPDNTFVTFPLHRSGKVLEVVDEPSLCPKVVDEYLNGSRMQAFCQKYCQRCHNSEKSQ